MNKHAILNVSIVFVCVLIILGLPTMMFTKSVVHLPPILILFGVPLCMLKGLFGDVVPRSYSYDYI